MLITICIANILFTFIFDPPPGTIGRVPFANILEPPGATGRDPIPTDGGGASVFASGHVGFHNALRRTDSI